MKILIVDDSMALRKILQRAIRNAGINIDEVQEACDGVSALQCLQAFKPDVILSDINMPNMDGLEFLRRLRTFESFNSLPVIMVSTEATRERLTEAIELGAVGFICKPFTESELRDKLKVIQK